MKTTVAGLFAWGFAVILALAIADVANAGVISAGYYDSFGVKADNSLWGWGYDGGTADNYTDPDRTQTVSIARAQLGLGPTNTMVNGEYVASPTQSGTAMTWLDVVGGVYHGFGIKSDGSLWAWGYDGTPDETDMGSSDNICSRYHYEQMGALGLGAQMIQLITRIYTNSQVYTNSVMNGLATNQPTQVGSGNSWRQVAVGAGGAGNDIGLESFGLGLQADGSIWSWGSESMTTTPQYDTNGVQTGTFYQANGQLGQGNMLGRLTNCLTSNVFYYVRAINTPTQITAPTSMIYVTAGQAHSAAIGSDGSLWTWGENQDGTYVSSVYVTNYPHWWDTNLYVHELIPIYNTNRSVLGLGDATLIATNVPARVGSETTWASVSAGLNADFTLAIKTDGSLWGWGNNGYAGASYYWLGSSSSYYYDQNATATNTYVLRTWAQGYLGLGSNTLFADTPTRVGTDNNWAMVSSGNAHGLGLRSDGSLYAWGNNSNGRLGLSRGDAYVAVPTRIGTDNDWVFISAGYSHSLALKSDGSLYAWGANTYAALGDQSGDAYEPVKISSGWGYSDPVIAASENGGGDYDGDGKTDFVIYDAATGNWLVRLSSFGYTLFSLDAMLGGPGYRLVTADFDGDGQTDPAVYQESTGTWLVKLSASGYTQVSEVLGGSGYTAVPADYDGDAKADYAVYNKTLGEWRIHLSAIAYTILKTTWAGCVPVPMDYDGDKKADLMVYEAATGNWQVMLSAYGDATIPLPSFLGGNNYLAVPMDYDGDELADPAVYGESTGVWQIRLSSFGYWMYDSSVYGWGLGGTDYIPTPADYDGDGLADLAVYSLITGQWTIMLSAYGYIAFTTSW